MAIQRVGIQFDFNANTAQAQTNLNALEKTMARLETRMQTMGAPRMEGSGRGTRGKITTQGNLANFGEEVIDLKSPIKQTEILTDNIRKGKIGWDEYGRAVKNNSAIVTQQLAMQTGAIHSVQRAGKGFQAVFTPNSSLSGISNIEFATAKMNAFGESTRAVSQNVIDMGKNLAFSARQMTISLSMPMAIMGGLAIKQFTDVDKQLTNITKVYDATANGVEESTGRIRESMKNLAKELSRTQGAEIEDTLNIAQFYAQQGKTGDELKNSTVQATRLMTLGDVDISDAQKTITTLTAVVGANAEQLGTYVDYLNKVEDSTQLTMQDFAKTLPTIAPLVKTFAKDQDQLMTSSASMMEVARRAGFDPKESMNAWKSMYGSFVRPTKQTSEEFSNLTAKYGQRRELREVVSAADADPVRVLSELSKITEEWSTIDKGELMTRLTGKWQLSRGLGFMQALDPDVGNNREAIDRMSGINDELVNNPEQLADNSKRQMDLIRNSAHTKLQQFKQDVQFMFADLGERIFIPVMDALENVLGVAKVAYNTLSSLPGPIKDILSIGAQLTFIAGPVLAAFAATKMLAGFAGKLAASFTTTAASAARMSASLLGVNMKGSGKLQSRQQSIANIQEKDDDIINAHMQEALHQENASRRAANALIDEKNAKTREHNALLKESNRLLTGSATPVSKTAAKDPKTELKNYQNSLTNTKKEWPMAIKAQDIGPQSFRRHAGRIGAPATRVAGIGLEGNKVFASGHQMRSVGMIHRTESTKGGVTNEVKQHIQKELDKVNSGIAIRRSNGERSAAEINADLKRLQVQEEMARRGRIPTSARYGTARAEEMAAQRSNITEQQRKLMSSFSNDGVIAGEKSLGLDSLEAQKAQLLRAANGSQIEQSRIMAQIQAVGQQEVNARRANNAAIQKETKKLTLTEKLIGAGGKVRDTFKTRVESDAARRAQQQRAWSENTVRGGMGDYFRGHMTPKDIRDAQQSKALKEVRKRMMSSEEGVNVSQVLDETVGKRARDKLTRLHPDATKAKLEEVTQEAIAKAVPNRNAFDREIAQDQERMIQRADKLESRQEHIAEQAGRWGANLTNASMTLGVIGTMATSALGVQNKLVDGALMFANGIGAVGMMMPGVMEKVTGGLAGLGGKMLDKFDATSLGTKIGGQLGDTMGTTMSARLSSYASSIGSLFMAALPYIAAIGIAMLAIKKAWDIHRADSAAYVKSLEEANRSVELHADLLGYVRKEQKDINDLSYEEATTKRANSYRENEDGRSNFVGEVGNVSGTWSERVQGINMVLDQEAIKIINDGGDQADVRSMVDAALEAAGVQDEQVIRNVKLHFKDFETTVGTAASNKVMEDLKSQLAGIDTSRSGGDQIKDNVLDIFSVKGAASLAGSTALSGIMPGGGMLLNKVVQPDRQDYASENLTDTAKARVEEWSQQLTSAINTASTDEQKAAIAKKWIETVDAARLEAEASGNEEQIGTSIGMRKEMFDNVFKGLENNSMSGIAATNEQFEKLKDNMIVLQSVIGGENQKAFNAPENAANKYKTALEQIEAVKGDLSDEEKKALHNAIAYAGGMKMVVDETKMGTQVFGEFERVVKDANGELNNSSGFNNVKDLFEAFKTDVDTEQMDAQAERTRDLGDALRGVPEEFHKRWTLEVDAGNPDSIKQFVDSLQSAVKSGQNFAAEEASRQFQDRQEATMDQIKSETEGAMAGLDAKQKASEKAFEARGKALDAQFKAESKNLEKQQKEEKKAYDKVVKERDKDFNKRQRDDQRAYDKQENAKRKEFSKQQQAEKKQFDDSWDDRADVINGYYDNVIKAIDNEGKAEEKLDQIRERNAERERKRRAFLAEMANTNIDINVAVAGGNLDEAARLANSAASSSTDYYQDQINTEAGYTLQDNNDARQARSESVGLARTASMDEFGNLREAASDEFGEGQDLASEKKDEELQLARDIYDEKKTLEAEQYEEQKTLEAERFAERQALEQERLQAAQERQKEALEAEKAAISERHAAERDMIQETANKKEEGARRHFEATQRTLDMELEALMATVPKSQAEMDKWIGDLEQTYARHGVYLNDDFAPKVNDGMAKAMTVAMDKASNEMATQRNWADLGENIGLQMREGLLTGFSGSQIASMLLFGKDPGRPELIPDHGGRMTPDFSAISQGNRPRRKAQGGAIYGPGTATSDSIPALLSNGEHVWTAKEVAALGGHKTMERLRQAILSGNIPKFATGGGVGADGSSSNSDLNVRVSSTGAGSVADGGVLSAITKDVAGMGSQFDQTLTNTVAPAWQMFGDTMVQVKKDSIDPVLEGSKIALQDYANQTNQIMSANMNPAWFQFGQNLQNMKSTVWDIVMTDMKAGLQSLSASTATAIGNEIMPKWTEGSNHVKTMQDTIIAPAMQQTRDATTQTAQNFGTAADMIGTGWGRVKENSAEPVRYTIGTVFNDGLVGMWNKVAEALDLDKMNKHEFSFATGGVMPGYTPGRDVHKFVSPTGGQLHLSGGEAIMRPEWTRAVGGPAAVEKMNSAARSGRLSPARQAENEKIRQSHALGGVMRFARGGVVEAMEEIVGQKYPMLAPAFSSYRNTPDNHGRGLAADFSNGTANTPAMTALAWDIAKTYPGSMELIYESPGFDKQIKNGQYVGAGGGSYGYFAGAGNHANHVHWAMDTPPNMPFGGGVFVGGSSGLGSGGGMDPRIMEAVTKFNEEKAALKDKIKAHIDAGPDTIMKAIPGKIFSGITAGMDKKIQAAMPIMSGATIGAYGLNHEDHVREIIAAAHERGLPKEAARIAIATALVESELRMYASHRVPESLNYPHEAIGSDHTSVGLFQQQDFAPWGTVAERMNARASAHLFYNQLVKFDWQSMAPGDAAQKVQVSAFPAKYATRMAEADALMNMVGGYDANAGGVGKPEDKDVKPKESKFGGGGAGGYFDQGGIASGMGLMNKAVISPERVLSPRQTQAFEQLVPAMNRVAQGGIDESQFMAKTEFDRSAAFQKMIERNSQAEIDFTNILEKLTPIITQLVGQLKGQIVPGITGYATDLIKLDTDAQRIDKVSEDIVAAITGIQTPEINTDMQIAVGGNIYGDAALNATLERWKQDIIRTVQAQQAIAQQAIGGK